MRHRRAAEPANAASACVDHAAPSRVSLHAEYSIPAGIILVEFLTCVMLVPLARCRFAHSHPPRRPATLARLSGSNPCKIIPEATQALRARGCSSVPVIVAGTGTAVSHAGSAALLAPRRIQSRSHLHGYKGSSWQLACISRCITLVHVTGTVLVAMRRLPAARAFMPRPTSLEHVGGHVVGHVAPYMPAYRSCRACRLEMYDGLRASGCVRGVRVGRSRCQPEPEWSRCPGPAGQLGWQTPSRRTSSWRDFNFASEFALNHRSHAGWQLLVRCYY